MKFKMADGSHFENRKIAISQQWFDRLSRNLAWWLVLNSWSKSAVKISNLKKNPTFAQGIAPKLGRITLRSPRNPIASLKFKNLLTGEKEHSFLNYTVSQKTFHIWFAITFTYANAFWYFFGRSVTHKVSNQRHFTIPPQVTCASALPGKTEKHKNRIFHSNAVSVHCQNSVSRSLISSVFLTHYSYSRCCMTP